MFLASALVGLLLGLVVALIQTPEYRAAAMLQIEPPTPTFMTVTDPAPNDRSTSTVEASRISTVPS